MQKIVSIDNFKIKKQLKNNMICKYEVAQYFLNKHALSVKELQILCFYSYAWYYSLYEKELFINNFTIKNNYPMDLELRDKYKEYGISKIFKCEDIVFEKDIENFLDYVFDVYKLFHYLELYKLIEFEIKDFKLYDVFNKSKLNIYSQKYGNLINSPTDVIYNIKINLNNILQEAEY